MRTPCSLRGTRAASATFVKTRATGTARRAGPCTDMPVLRTQTAGMACGAEGSTHGSTRPSGRSLQTNLGDGRTQRCVSVWVFWTGACEGPGSRCADPRLVLTHRLSLLQWSKGCKTLTSYRMEGPGLSRPSPVGLRSLLARWGHPLPSLWWSGCRDTWEVAGRTESHSRVWWYGGANETGWGALARPPRTVLVTPTNPPTYPRWGSEGERRDPARASRCRSEAGSACVTHLPAFRQRVRE